MYTSLRYAWDTSKSARNLMVSAQGIMLTVVYTDRFKTAQTLERRIISARRSNRNEREAYQQAIEGG